ncbi:hypothetical protein [Streptomyces cacaoi]|uniref:hypothetical protein n=1 Tax=Streptomyces cacaoi TaxID=1898 RepID=UPI0011F33A5D|nr:hypothetical protein [Streptomyces cacaoi]
MNSINSPTTPDPLSPAREQENRARRSVFIPTEDDMAGRFSGVLVAHLDEPEELLAVTEDVRAAVRAAAAYEAYKTGETWPVSLTSPDLDPNEIAAYVQVRLVTFHRTDHHGWIVQPAAPDTPGAVAVTWLDTSSLCDAAEQGRPVPLTPHREQTSDSRAIEDALDDACQELEVQLEAATSRAHTAQARATELEKTLRQVWHVLTAAPPAVPSPAPATLTATETLPQPASAEDGASCISQAPYDIDRLLAENDRLRSRVAELEQAQREVRALHTDSPMGPCPTCIDADALAAGSDGLVPYPCPTARAAGARDADPPNLGGVLAALAENTPTTNEGGAR